MTCTACSTEVPDNARFCAGCGMAFDAPGSASPGRVAALVSRARRVKASTAVAVACVAALGVAGVTVVDRERERTRTLDRTSAQLTETRANVKTLEGDLAKQKGRGDKLSADLKKSQGQAATLRTQLTGVRGSLKATSSERDVLRTCFTGFLESLEAASAGDRAKFERVWKDIEDECEKADRLLG